MTDDNTLFNWEKSPSIASPPPAPPSLKSVAPGSVTGSASSSPLSSYLFGPYGTMVATFVVLLIIQPPFVRHRSPPYDLSYTRLFSWVVVSGALSAAAQFFFPVK